MSNPLLILTVILLLGCGAAIMLLLRKVRRIDIAVYSIRTDASEARRESAALFGQLQAFTVLDRLLGLQYGMPPMRGWAGSPDMLLAVAERILQTKPVTILECSSGVSTVVAARCCQIVGHGHVFSLEHEGEYAEKTRRELMKHGLQDWATVYHAPLVPVSAGQRWYSDAVLPADLPPIDLMVVDGPPASVNSQSRYPAFPRLRSKMAPNATLLLDDADRPDERAIVQRWTSEEPSLVETRLPAEKGLVMLQRCA